MTWMTRLNSLISADKNPVYQNRRRLEEVLTVRNTDLAFEVFADWFGQFSSFPSRPITACLRCEVDIHGILPQGNIYGWPRLYLECEEPQYGENMLHSVCFIWLVFVDVKMSSAVMFLLYLNNWRKCCWRIRKKEKLWHVCPPICRDVNTRGLLHGFSWNLLQDSFINPYRTNVENRVSS